MIKKIEPMSTICFANELASSINTIELVIAPGPQIMGMAKGVIDMSVT